MSARELDCKWWLGKGLSLCPTPWCYFSGVGFFFVIGLSPRVSFRFFHLIVVCCILCRYGVMETVCLDRIWMTAWTSSKALLNLIMLLCGCQSFWSISMSFLSIPWFFHLLIACCIRCSGSVSETDSVDGAAVNMLCLPWWERVLTSASGIAVIILA